jgi:hypothetical protein
MRCGQTIALAAIGDLPITLRTNSRFWRESVSTRIGRVCLERRRRGRDALGYPLWQNIRFNRIFCDSRIAAEASSLLLPHKRYQNSRAGFGAGRSRFFDRFASE